MGSDMINILAGAHKGQNIHKYLKNDGKVYAIEAHPSNAKSLRDKWGNEPRVTIIDKAAWIYDGEITFKVYKSSCSHSIYKRGKEYVGAEGEREITIPCFDFSAFLKGLGEVNHIRMNIEGAEYEVLLKCLKEGTLDKVKYIMVACHASKITELRGLDGELKRALKRWNPKGDRYDVRGKGGSKAG